MGQIQSSVGLITGLPIIDTVDKLISVSARPRDLITARNKSLKSEQVAIDQLTSRLLGLQLQANRLADPDLFAERKVTSSDSSALSASLSAGGSPAVGSYRFTPVRTAQAQQFLSSEIEDLDAALGSGSLSFQYGGFVDQGVKLDDLNDGDGVRRGEIRITDRAGSTAVIDLKFARTIDDVLKAISDNGTINVEARAVDGAIQLVDNTGGSGTLSVQEIRGGSTAAGLGLAGIAVAADVADGSTLLRLHADTRLASLHDGAGVGFLDELADLGVTLADGTSLEVDFAAGDKPETTLGELLETINAASPTKLTASISSDGRHLELTDLTSGGGTFAVTSLVGGTAAEDLGLTGTASGGVLTSDRLIGGLKTTLLSSLKGGAGLGDLGVIQITDRSGAENLSVDLSSAETLDDVIERINDAGVGVKASVNKARNGIEIRDTSGGNGNLTIANGDATNTAEHLGIAVDQAVTRIDSKSLDRRSVSRQTRLADLNRSQGVELGSIKITDSTGTLKVLKLDTPGAEAKTLGDVIDRVNALGLTVEARINDRGDGITLEDTGGGAGTLKVEQSGSKTTARDLHLLSAATTEAGTQSIDGTSRLTIEIAADDTLSDVIEAINDLDVGVTASSFFTGSGYRLTLGPDATGQANELLVDTSDTSLELDEVAEARDALLLFGSTQNAGAGLLVQSADNTFENAIEGVDLTVKEASDDPITIDVTASDESLTVVVSALIKSYNTLRDDLAKATSFDPAANTTGILFGSRAALRVDSDLSNLITGQFFGAGDFHSLGGIGIEIDDQGKLSLDQSKLQAAFDSNSADLEKLFTDENRGFGTRLTTLIDQLGGKDGSALAESYDALANRVKVNEERISLLTTRLSKERERLLKQFYQMEQVVARMRNDLSSLQSLQIIAPGSVSLGQ